MIQGVDRRMSVSLYRKYRPTRFEDIIGQEHVARTLVNAINSDRVSHAYLFTGPRGTGKTSTAKILAMALNCESGQGKATTTPDGTCACCEAIRRGSSMDVVEMDAASNRGIDDIRDLRDKVHFAPVEGRMKVYIVDEVHMLTPEAFNALLKTLEEPPVHAVFVLATTEPHKVPATILSRCQRFDFRRPSIGEVVEVLSGVAAQEGIETDAAALLVIARAAGGSFRDALGILDQLSTYTGGKVTLQETLDILGVVRHDLLFEIVDLAREHDTQGALLFVERLSQGGTDYGQFIKDLLSHLRDLYVVRHTEEAPASIAATEEQLERLRSQAAQTPTGQIIALLDLLGEALRSIRQGSDPRLELELALIKFTAAGEGTTPGLAPTPSIAAAARRAPPKSVPVATPPRPSAPEPRKSSAGGPPSSPESERKADDSAPSSAAVSAPSSHEASEADQLEAPEHSPAASVYPDIAHLKQAWPIVLEAVKKRQAGLAAVLGLGIPDSLDGDTLVIKFPAGHGFQAGQMARGESPKVITEVLLEITGRPLRVSTKLIQEAEQKPGTTEEDARILSNDELIGMLKREFNAQVLDDEPRR
jgi:DNA polymerase-3 subunit gamma/tau